MLMFKDIDCLQGHMVRLRVSIAAAAMLALAATAAAAAETIGVIKRSQGDVVLLRGADEIAVKPGMQIERGDRLITGESGYASISMRRAASLSVGANSAVPLDRYAAEAAPVVRRVPPGILQSLASFFAVNRQR
jgi:hypothetical protein